MKRTFIPFEKTRVNPISLFLFLITLCFNLTSQSWQWARSEKIEGGGMAICNDPQGNTFMAGYTWAPGNIGTSSFTAGSVAFVTKYGASGNILWTRGFAFKSFNNGRCNGVASDNAGNVFISGSFAGTMVVGSNTLVSYIAPNGVEFFDMFLVKYDASGNLLWAKAMGGKYNESGNSLATDPGGNVYVAGQFSTFSLAVGQSTISAYSNGTYFIAKYSPNGTPLWAVAPAPTAGGSAAYNLNRDNKGNLVICGAYQYSLSVGSTTLTSSGNGDQNFFVAKYDSVGQFKWLRGGGDTQNELAFAVDADPAGNIYVTGGFYSPNLVVGTTTLTSAGSADAFVTKYDASGNILWAKNVGSPGLEVGRVVRAYAGGFFLAGSVAPFGTCTLVIGTTSISPTSIAARWLAHFDGSGNPTGYVSYDQGTGNTGLINHPLAMVIDQGCNLYLGGSVQYQAIIGKDTIKSVGSSSPFLAKLLLPTSNTVTVNVAGNLSICNGNTTTLTATGAAMFNWIGGPSSGVFVVTPNSTQSYTVTGNTGCDIDSAVVTVTVNPTPSLMVSSGQPTYCSGSVAQLSVTGANSYTWSTGATAPTATFVTGNTTTITVTGNNSSGNCSSTSAFVVNVSSCTRLQAITGNEFKVYPNPSHGIVSVEMQGAAPYNLVLTDALGRKLSMRTINESSATLDLGDLTAGVYFICIVDQNEKRMVKLIKE